MQSRTIKTKLIGKEELFNILTLSEVLQLPILFVGEPGVAKTQTVIDYAGAMYNNDTKLAREKCFLLELDEGTQTSEIKGRMNISEYVENSKFIMDTPIADAEFIMINEVDKGSSSIRNTMLSVMRERALFLGNDIRRCKWKVFAATCNIIPKDEENSPFWDRFVLKFKVERMQANIIPAIWAQGINNVDINIPDNADINHAIDNIPLEKSIKFLDLAYPYMTDRSLSYLPKLIAGVKLVYNLPYTDAIIKVAEYVCPSQMVAISTDIESKTVTTVKATIEKIWGVHEDDSYGTDLIEDVFSKIKAIRSTSSISSDEVKEYKVSLLQELRKACSVGKKKDKFNKLLKDNTSLYKGTKVALV